MKNLFFDLYEARKRRDKQQQPEVSSRLADLEDRLLDDEVPYDSGPDTWERLLAARSFAEANTEFPAELSRADFLYRICSISKLMRFTQWKFETELSPPRLIERLKTLARSRQEEWLPLEILASGQLTGPREFTWWSIQPVAKNKPMSSLHKRGLPNDWIDPYSVILRCKVSSLPEGALYVPTAVEGFDSPIFFSVASTPPPNAGRSIDLSNSRTLRLGIREYFLTPIGTSLLELQPVVLDTKLRKDETLVTLAGILAQLVAFAEDR